jgi:MFS superfamily sulfate permease-like transporter
MLKKFDETTGMVKYLVELELCWEILAGMAVATIFISIFYIFLLKWLTKPLLYVSMLIILVAFVLLGGWLWLKKDEYDPVVQE